MYALVRVLVGQSAPHVVACRDTISNEMSCHKATKYRSILLSLNPHYLSPTPPVDKKHEWIFLGKENSKLGKI